MDGLLSLKLVGLITGPLLLLVGPVSRNGAVRVFFCLFCVPCFHVLSPTRGRTYRDVMQKRCSIIRARESPNSCKTKKKKTH